MATLTIRLPDEQHERLELLAARRGTSLNKLFEEFSVKALAEADAEARFLARAARRRTDLGLALLDKIDAYHGRS
jgi:predicted DNA-binding protein